METYVQCEKEEQKCLDDFYRFFKYERLAWKIPGIVLLVISIIFMAFGSIFILAGIVAEDPLVAVAGLYTIYGLLFLPLAIICLKMVKRTEYYMDVVHTDVRPVIKRCNSVGMIVFGALFNNIAMAFIIVNFVFAKTKAPMLEEIARKQSMANME